MHFYEAIETIKPKEEVKVEQTQPVNQVTQKDIEDLKNAFAEQMKAELEKSRSEMLEFLRQQNIETNNDDEDKKEVVDNNEEKKEE